MYLTVVRSGLAYLLSESQHRSVVPGGYSTRFVDCARFVPFSLHVPPVFSSPLTCSSF